MTRYSEEHKQNSRTKILKSAAALFRKSGYNATGVDAVMGKAGLTAGAFYAHFDSKAALFAETLGVAAKMSRKRLLAGLESLAPAERFTIIVKRYLSREHRDDAASGCPVPPLVSELARADAKARKAFEEYLSEVVDKWGAATPSDGHYFRGTTLPMTGRERALATFCLMVGGITFARAVHSKELSDQILKACRKLALGGLE